MTKGPWPLKLVRTDHYSRCGGHYTTNAIEGDAMEIVRDLEPDDINWVFLSTSGVHGSYASLDDVELLWTDPERYRKENHMEDSEALPDEEDVTVLIVLPRMVTTAYGTATVRSLDDVALLRQRVEQTLAGIEKLQAGNRAKALPEGPT